MTASYYRIARHGNLSGLAWHFGIPDGNDVDELSSQHNLYRALDSTGNTLDFMLNPTRSGRAAKRFFRKVLGGKYVTAPRVINVDKNPTTIGAVRDLKHEKLLPEKCKRRPSQYMNNIIEQDHRFMKRRIRPGLGFFSYPTAWRTIRGFEAVHMIRKGQVRGADKGNIRAQNQFIAGVFGLAI